MSQTVLLVDDEPDILRTLEIALARMNLNTVCADSLSSAMHAINEAKPDLCLTDMRLPDGNGLQLVEHVQHLDATLPVAVITAHGSVETATEALKLGAFDFVSKPVALDKLRELVGHALKLKTASPSVVTHELLGPSTATERLRAKINKVARSQAPVHVYGESGAGKEVVARLIHRSGSRHDGPFIAVNCGAIPPELVESELFGHLKGSFTGAVQDKQGLFQAAKGGTLMLDEIAELPQPVQVKLLRAIQEKAVRPVGSETEVATDVRLISATHQRLNDLVASGRFREDLFYRINVIDVEVPSLAQRRDDIPDLVTNHLSRLAVDEGFESLVVSDAAMERLISNHYPGNVRQLENILARAAAMADSGLIEEDDLEISPVPVAMVAEAVQPSPIEASEQDQKSLLAQVNGDLDGHLEAIEREILTEAMTAHRWNRTAAAEALGVSFRSLRYRLKKLGLDD